MDKYRNKGLECMVINGETTINKNEIDLTASTAETTQHVDVETANGR